MTHDTTSHPAPLLARRGFLVALGAVAAAAPRALLGQAQGGTLPGATMDGDGYRPVRLPPKATIERTLTSGERDATERRLSCPCPCTLDVFTCRTSMPCGFSPRMHSDVVSLSAGGYTEQEILDAFEAEYGEVVLMSPRKAGFNLVGWLAPFLAILTGGILIFWLLRGWRRPEGAPAIDPAVRRLPTDATPEELARLDRAVREADR